MIRDGDGSDGGGRGELLGNADHAANVEIDDVGEWDWVVAEGEVEGR